MLELSTNDVFSRAQSKVAVAPPPQDVFDWMVTARASSACAGEETQVYIIINCDRS